MKTLSICIPSINRKAYLSQALRSILECTQHTDRLEICVSNNNSEEDYTEIETYLKSYPCAKYIRQLRRISLDENMHACVTAASGTYVYYLGDDDYFLPGGLDELFEIIDRDHPDLVILNGLQVDAEGLSLGRTFASESKIFRDFPTAYKYYNTKGAFGAVLVKREYLNNELFRKFYGTSHAYSCFWAALAILHESHRDFHLVALTPQNPIVALRQAKKTYSDLDVNYDHIPRWYVTLLGYISNADLKRTMNVMIEQRSRHNTSIRVLAHRKLAGTDISKIRGYPGHRRSFFGDSNLLLIEITPIRILRIIRSIRYVICREAKS